MTHCKLYQHEKGNRNYQQGPRGNEEYNFGTEGILEVEGIKSRLDEAHDRIGELEDKVEKEHSERVRRKKEAQKE